MLQCFQQILKTSQKFPEVNKVASGKPTWWKNPEVFAFYHTESEVFRQVLLPIGVQIYHQGAYNVLVRNWQYNKLLKTLHFTPKILFSWTYLRKGLHKSLKIQGYTGARLVYDV